MQFIIYLNEEKNMVIDGFVVGGVVGAIIIVVIAIDIAVILINKKK